MPDQDLDLVSPELAKVFNIELTNHCSMRCVMCPRTEHMTRSLGNMDFSVYARIIDDLTEQGVNYSPQLPLWLHGFGESLLHPEFDRFVRYAADRGIDTGLSVNPLVLTREKATRLLHSGLSALYLSLDGHDNETFEAIRGLKGAYDKSFARVHEFLADKVRAAVPMHVSLSMINFPLNSTSIEEIGDYWRGVQGVDAVLSKGFVTWDGSSDFINKLSPRKVVTDESRPVSCRFPWESITVKWNGDVVPCCFDFDAKHILGNAITQSLSEIWDGEAMHDLRRQFSTNRVTSPLCSGCEQLRSPEVLEFPEPLADRIAMTVSAADADADDRVMPRQACAGSIVRQGDLFAQIMHNGVRVVKDGYYGPWMTEIIRKTRGIHEPQEERVFHEVLREMKSAGAMMELGAFWSYYSIWFRTVFPEARSILVEPDPSNLNVGKVNFALNNLNGEFLQASVGGESRSEVNFDCESDRATRKIPLTSVDWLMSHFHLDEVDLLLADIQGAEVDMLDGMQRAVTNGKIRVVFVSTHDVSISGDYLTHQKCLQRFRDWGAHIIAEHSVEESFSGDGLIVASFDPELRFTVEVSYNRPVNSLFGESAPRLAKLFEEKQELEAKLSNTVLLLSKERESASRVNDLVKEAQSHSSRLAEYAAREAAREKCEQRILSRSALRRKSSSSRLPPVENWFRIREWKRLFKAKSQQAKCRKRINELRSGAQTESILGCHAIYEILKGDKAISPYLKTHKNWEFKAQQQAVSLVEGVLGRRIRHTTLLDIGANIGVMGLQALDANLFSRVIAVEPDPDNFALLWSNVETNAWTDRFLVEDCALGTENGLCQFELSKDNFGDHRVRSVEPWPEGVKGSYAEEERQVISIPMRTLDTVLDKTPGDFKRNIGLCWMDVQGYEWKVVEGGLGHFITRKWPAVMEFWPYGMKRAGTSLEEIQNLATKIWKQFFILDHPQHGWQDLSRLGNLWDELGEVEFVNVLFV